MDFLCVQFHFTINLLKQMILQQKEKYRYAYKFNGDRMARQKIMMPVDEESKINYSTIENYMRAKELEFVVNDILKYLVYGWNIL